MNLQDAFERILEHLHAAAFDDSHCAEVARLVSEASQTKGLALVSGQGRFQTEIDIFFIKIHCEGQRREDREREYLTDYWLHDESIPRIAQLPDGRLANTGDLYTDREKRISPAYNVARRDTQKGLQVRLDGPDGSHIVCSLGDSLARDGWGSDQLEMISHLLPHLRQFVRVRQALADAGALGNSFATLLDNTRCGVIQLDRRGRVAAANDRACVLLRAGEGLVDPNGGLTAVNAVENKELQRLLARALPPFGVQPLAGSMTIRRSRGAAGRTHQSSLRARAELPCAAGCRTDTCCRPGEFAPGRPAYRGGGPGAHPDREPTRGHVGGWP